MYHCTSCCLRVRLTAGRTLSRHYVYKQGFFSSAWRAEVCKGSGTDSYTSMAAGRCSRTHAGQRCPVCGSVVTLNKNGRFGVHDTPQERRCELT